LSWNYNYYKASLALTGSADTFCDNPELVATEEEFAWGAGIFYWMENLKAGQIQGVDSQGEELGMDELTRKLRP
jgi:hypothetical protein